MPKKGNQAGGQGGGGGAGQSGGGKSIIDQLKEKDDRIKELEKRVPPAGQSYATTLSELNLTKTELTQIKKECDAATKARDEATKARDEATKQRDDATQELGQEKNKLETLQKEYDGLNGINTKNVSTVNALKEEISRKDVDLQSMKTSLDAKIAAEKTDTIEIDTLKQSNQTLKSENDSLKPKVQDVDRLKAEVDELMEKTGRLELEIAAFEAQAGNGDTTEAIQKIQEQYKDESTKQKQQNETDKRAIEAHLKTIQENKEALEAATLKEIEYQRATAADKLIIDKQEKTIADDKKKFEDLDKAKSVSNANFNKTIQELTAHLVDAQTSIAAHEGTIADRDVTIKIDKKAIADRDATIQTRDDTIAQVSKEKNYYQDQYQEKIKELLAANTQLAAANSDDQIKLLMKQVADVTTDKGVLSKQIIDLQHTNDTLTVEIDNLKKQLLSVHSTSVKVPRLTEKERKDQLTEAHRKRLDELLQELRSKIDFPIKKPSV